MQFSCLVIAAIALANASADAADLTPQTATAPPPGPGVPSGSSVPNSAFFLGLGGSANWTNFTDQHVYAIGTSNVYSDGIQVASGSAQGPTRIPMSGRFAFAPSFQGGYFQRFGASEWLWGAKLSYNYLGANLDQHELDHPSIWLLHHHREPHPRGLQRPGLCARSQDECDAGNRLHPVPWSRLRSKLCLRWRRSNAFQARTQLNGLVGFAFVNGAIVDQSGVPQDFSSSSWLFGGAATVGVTYFLTPSWFIDLNYTYATTEGHTSKFSSPFVDRSSTSVGTFVGNSAWTAQTQRVALTINKAF